MDNRYDWMKGRYYKHYKGGIYQVIDVAIHRAKLSFSDLQRRY